MKYTKKPVEIEAIQWNGTNLNEILEFADEYYVTQFKDTLRISTLEGLMTASLNDYIIKGIQGEIYPCKPDIFKLTYDEHQSRN